MVLSEFHSSKKTNFNIITFPVPLNFYLHFAEFCLTFRLLKIVFAGMQTDDAAPK